MKAIVDLRDLRAKEDLKVDKGLMDQKGPRGQEVSRVYLVIEVTEVSRGLLAQQVLQGM